MQLRLYALAHLIRTVLYLITLLGVVFAVGHGISLLVEIVKRRYSDARMLAATASASMSSL